MSDLNIQLILRLVDRATAPARAAMAGLNRLGANGAAMLGRAREQSVALAGALGGAAGAATRMGAAFGVIGGLTLRSFINEAAQFEKFRVQLENLEGSTAGADRAMAWIEDFATRTPLQVDQVVSAYARLRAFGLDPTDGTMRALVDTMAATGGGAELLDGLVLALGQSWSKGKLQGEEALQLLERGVPVYDLLAKKLGVTTEEVIAMQGAGELGREEIKLLVEAMAEANAGASEDMAGTWEGIISNLWEHWGRFKRLVMDAGVFDWLKTRLQGLLQTLNQMAANGDLQRWAEQVSAGVIRLFERIGEIGTWVAGAWESVSPWIGWAVEQLGGVENAIATIVALKFAPHIIAIGNALIGLSLFAVPIVVWALGKIGAAVIKLATLAMAHPLIALTVLLVAGAIWAYYNWDKVVAVFEALKAKAEEWFTYLTGWTFDDVANTARNAWNRVVETFTWLKDKATAVYDYITGWTFADVTAAIKTAFTIDLYQLGVDMLNSLWEGMKSVIGNMTTSIRDQIASIAPDWDPTVTGRNLAAEAYPFSGSYRGGDGADGGPSDGPQAERAAGGPVRAGMIYRWQENGEEFFRPRTDGTVINAQGSRALLREGRSSTVNLGGITINAAPGMSPDAIARAVRREIARLTEGAGTELHDGGLYAR